MSKSKLFVYAVIAAVAVGSGFYFFQPANGKSASALSPAQTVKNILVFTSPPRETPEEGEALYKPIAEYLSATTGKKIVYKHPGTWGLYRTEMLNGDYDIIFDGGHFSDYRAQKLGYSIIAKMPELQEFAIIARKDSNVTSVDQLAGQTICAPPPPNQGALHLMSQFKDPAKQPVVVPVTGNFWAAVYEGVVTGSCKAGVLVVANLQKLDKEGAIKIVHKTAPQPNQAFSVSPRVAPEDREKIAAALVASESTTPTQNLRERFKIGERFVSANNAEYAGISEVLRNEWGFFDNK
jgi:ABC-type phosphate/phosphonate transport system substrate-binding protein